MAADEVESSVNTGPRKSVVARRAQTNFSQRANELSDRLSAQKVRSPVGETASQNRFAGETHLFWGVQI